MTTQDNSSLESTCISNRVHLHADLRSNLARLFGVLALATAASAQGAVCPDGTLASSTVHSAWFPSDCFSLERLDWGYPTPEVLSVPKFDSALGVLHSVAITSLVRFAGDVTVDNQQSSCGKNTIAPRVLGIVVPSSSNTPLVTGLSDSTFDFREELFPPGFRLGSSDGVNDCATPTGPQSIGDCAPGADHVFVFFDVRRTHDHGTLLDPDLLPWIAEAPGALVQFEAQAFGLFSGGSSSNSCIALNLFANLEIQVTYNYCPTPPGTSFCDCTSSGPCANHGSADEGYANTTGSGAKLIATGSNSLAAADLGLRGAQLPPHKPGLFFQGNDPQSGGNGIPFGDGLRCVAGSIVRLQVVTSNTNGIAVTSTDLALASGANAGDTRNYQLWYRDGPLSTCGFGFNLTNGVALVWAP